MLTRQINGAIKFSGFCLLLLVFILHHELIRLFISKTQRTNYYLKSIQLYCKLGLKLLNIHVDVQGFKQVSRRLIVSNHLSYVDVLVLCSYYPSLFVTSVEIRETFMLGRITQLAGCFFVERRKSVLTKQKSIQEIEEMKMTLLQGHNVFLFPEGTSSNGQNVLPFKNTFFQLAIDSGTKIQPLCLNYGPFASAVAWYGDMTFVDHLFQLCQLPRIHVTIKQLSDISPDGLDRFDLARKTQTLISEAYLGA